jgi:succinate dehydrogenase/fumarate reductase cytochrome b subunit
MLTGHDFMGSTCMGSTFNGLIGLIILALDIWAIINVVKSGGSTGSKLLWILLILVLPVVGLIIWAIAGPRGNVRV